MVLTMVFAFAQIFAARFGVEWIRSLAPNMPKMTMLTALLFIGSCALVLGFRHCRQSSNVGAFFVGGLTWGILLTIAFECWLSMSAYLAYESPTILNPRPGHPSACTLAAFFGVGSSGFAWAFRLEAIRRLIGVGVAFVGLFALVGYALDVPQLYCYFDPNSTAMAIPTALCLVAVGASQACIKERCFS